MVLRKDQIEIGNSPYILGLSPPRHDAAAALLNGTGIKAAFWNLLKKSSERAPAPFLVNTSFNLFGEPLVISPRDAIRSFFCSGIDALVIHGFVLVKT